MNFVREHHQKIAHVLSSLNSKMFSDNSCYFGGGTAIALKFGEYRESVDIDFMVSDIGGYRQLRNLATEPGGLSNLFSNIDQIDTTHEVRADQYGIRSVLKVIGTSIRFEIVLDNRISFDLPSEQDVIAGISCLTLSDLIASKLLANSDRWGDAFVFSRDLIDLAFMKFETKDWAYGFNKAKAAYGDAIQKDFLRACEAFIEKPHHVQRCIQMLKIEYKPSELVEKVRKLKNKVSF
jgi:predicted nucleotidyltransferase component of viral defense system